jgi:hypothetical protein
MNNFAPLDTAKHNAKNRNLVAVMLKTVKATNLPLYVARAERDKA